MPDFSSRLPARPSLEQLHKRAKDLLRLCRSGDGTALSRLRAAKPEPADAAPTGEVTLADALFALAREHGFETWATLKRHVEAQRPPGMRVYEKLARELAAGYMSGNAMAVREVNWKYGTSFACDFHEPSPMQQRLPSWFASESRTEDLALNDTKQMVARGYGFQSWAAFADQVAHPPGDPRSAPVFLTSGPPFYRIDWRENRLSVQGPLSEPEWETVADVMREHGISKLSAGAITDAGMERVSRLGHVTRLEVGGKALTDGGARHLARMPQLVELELGGWASPLTDRGLEPVRQLTELRQFQMSWTQGISDAGVLALQRCERLEDVNLMGTPTGDGALRALAGKARLRRFMSGERVTDDGLMVLHQMPVFKTWQGGEPSYSLMRFEAEPNLLLLRGQITDEGMKRLVGLDGLFALNLDDAKLSITARGVAPLSRLPRLGWLGLDADDETMGAVAALPNLRMFMCQDTRAGDAGFAALSRSTTIEYIWGRRCYNLTGAGFAAMARMPALRGLSVSCRNVSDDALSALPRFPTLLEFMPMDVPDAGFRHVGRCENLEALWCMYCRETGDAATEQIAGLSRLKTYYAGMTQITDRSLEILSGMDSLERIELWQCAGLTDAGIAHLRRLPRLREVALDGLQGVSRKAPELFPAQVRVNYWA